MPVNDFDWHPSVLQNPVLEQYQALKGSVIHNPTELPPCFLNPKQCTERVSAKTNEPVFFDRIEMRNGEIYLMGNTCAAESVSLFIQDFQPSFFITNTRKLKNDSQLNTYKTTLNSVPLPPPSWEKGKHKKDETLLASLNMEKLPPPPVISVTSEERECAVGFSYGKKDELLRIRISSYTAFDQLRSYFRTNEPNVKMHHENWSIEDQFMMENKLNLFDWCYVDFTKVKLNAQLSRARIDGKAPCKALTPVKGITKVPPIEIMVFDLETVSQTAIDDCMMPEDQRSKTFYAPDPEKLRDRIISIGVEIYFHTQKDAIFSAVFGLDTSINRNRDAVYYTFDDEGDMLSYWFRFIKSKDIHVFAGFNSIHYDMWYTEKRCLTLKRKTLIQSLSRLNRFQHAVKLKPYKSTTSQRGEVVINFIDIPGVIQFDAYITARRNEKLEQYSLKEIAIKLLKDPELRKKDLPYADIAKHFVESEETRATIHEYCLRDVVVTRKLIIKRSYYGMYMKIGQISRTNMVDLLLRGVTLQTWHQIQKRVIERDMYMDEKKRQFIQAYYGVGKCPYCRDEEGETYGKRYEPASARKAPSKKKIHDINAKQFRFEVDGNLRKATKQRDGKVSVQKVLTFANFKYCRHGCPIYPEGSNSFTGGEVLDAKEGFYTRPVLTQDFSSLYPTIIMSHNLCFTTFLPLTPRTTDVCIENPFPEKKYEYLKIGEGLQTCHFMQKYDNKKIVTILTEILDGHLSERRQITKKLIPALEAKKEQCTNKDEKKEIETQLGTYDCHQKAIKICANGLYGAFAAASMKGSLKPVSMCTTYIGRNKILDTKKMAEEVFHCEVVYGDTDSVFLTIPESKGVVGKGDHKLTYEVIENNEKKTEENRWACIHMFGKNMAEYISRFMPPPMKLEFEKAMLPWKSFGKKNYAGYIRDEHGKVKEIIQRGVAAVRRDYCAVVRRISQECTNLLFDDLNADRVIPRLRQFCKEFSDGKIKNEDLMCTINVRTKFKNSGKTKLMQERLFEDMKKRGKIVTPGSRVAFYYVEPETEEQRRREKNYSEFVLDADTTEQEGKKLNLVYYLEKKIRNPIRKLLRGVVPQEVIDRMINQAIGERWRIRHYGDRKINW